MNPATTLLRSSGVIKLTPPICRREGAKLQSGRTTKGSEHDWLVGCTHEPSVLKVNSMNRSTNDAPTPHAVPNETQKRDGPTSVTEYVTQADNAPIAMTPIRSVR